jgi:glycosyltransferase involved in cell wall biosynthesis
MSSLTPSRITVVIPVHNDTENLRVCLEHLARQTLPASTIVVVDNDSDQPIESTTKGFKNIVVVKEERHGIPAATKRGLDAALDTSCDVIARLDADCRPNTDWLRRIAAQFEADSGTSAVTGPGEFYGISRVMSFVARLTYMTPYFILVGFALGQRPLFGSNFAIRSSTWARIRTDTHLGRQDIHDDMDISFHVLAHSAITFDRTLKMPISPRPFKDPKSMIQRVARGFRTILIHWPEQAPWRLYSSMYRNPDRDRKFQ